MMPRVTDGHLTRKARRAWPYATVTVAHYPRGDDHREDYQLERPGAEPLTLGANIKQARETLNRVVKDRLNDVALRWQVLVPAVELELERRGYDRSLLSTRLENRRLAVEIPNAIGGPATHVELMHDETIVAGDPIDIARQYVDHYEAKRKELTNA